MNFQFRECFYKCINFQVSLRTTARVCWDCVVSSWSHLKECWIQADSRVSSCLRNIERQAYLCCYILTLTVHLYLRQMLVLKAWEQFFPETKWCCTSYTSRYLSAPERNYGISELETLTIVWAIQHFHAYLHGYKVTMVTDHSAVCAILKTPNPSGKNAWWWSWKGGHCIPPRSCRGVGGGGGFIRTPLSSLGM